MHAHNERGPRGHSQDRTSPSVALKRYPSIASRSRLCGFCPVRVQCTRSCRATAILLSSICGSRYHGMERTTSFGPSTARASHGAAGHDAPAAAAGARRVPTDVQASTHADQTDRRWVDVPAVPLTKRLKPSSGSQRAVQRNLLAQVKVVRPFGQHWTGCDLAKTGVRFDERRALGMPCNPCSCVVES